MGQTSVEIIANDDQFVVKVTEPDGHVSENAFSIMDNAVAWANGQRKRLGLPLDDVSTVHADVHTIRGTHHP